MEVSATSPRWNLICRVEAGLLALDRQIRWLSSRGSGQASQNRQGALSIGCVLGVHISGTGTNEDVAGSARASHQRNVSRGRFSPNGVRRIGSVELERPASTPANTTQVLTSD